MRVSQRILRVTLLLLCVLGGLVLFGLNYVSGVLPKDESTTGRLHYNPDGFCGFAWDGAVGPDAVFRVVFDPSFCLKSAERRGEWLEVKGMRSPLGECGIESPGVSCLRVEQAESID